jgi:hypothetical protein
MYKSVNGGNGLNLASIKRIANIEVHPTDANIVFVAAMGNPFKSNPNAVFTAPKTVAIRN